ncbi:sensor histidine kinase [Lutimonas vermicola]|uniref:histidine kinase n=1 Tax=Lutimonas vermicola TaxID=414288 RepID=A0ABU9L1P4_9FLAO
MALFLMSQFILVQAQGVNALFRNITSAEGLPSTSVTGVTQDSFGLIWIGTWDGVYRFDGISFKKMLYEGRYVIADDKGGVWASQEAGQLAYFDSNKDSWKEYKGLDTERYGQISIDPDGNVFANSSKGFLKFNEELDDFVLDEGQNGNPVFGNSIGDNGRSHFLSYDTSRRKAVLGLRDGKGKFSYEDFPVDQNDAEKRAFDRSFPIIAIPYLEKGTLIVNADGYALRENDQADWTFHKPDVAEALTEMTLSGNIFKDGCLWSSQIDKLVKIKIESGETTVFKSNATNRNSILPGSGRFTGNVIFIDRQGVIWIPRFAHGISRLNLYESDFGLLKDEEGFPIRDVMSAFELEDGSFWIGERTTDRKGLIHFAPDGKSILQRIGSNDNYNIKGKSQSNKLSHPFVFSLLSSSDGSLWAGTGSPGAENGGLNRIRPGSDLITIFKNDPEDISSLPNNWIWDLFEDRNGRIWIRSRGELSFIEPKTEKITRFTPKGISGNLRPLQLDPDGNLVVSWSAGDDRSFGIIDADILKIDTVKINFPDKINFWNAGPHYDDLGRVWFASNTGFGYTDTNYEKVLEWFDFKEINFPASEIIAMNSDLDGNLWFGTDNGIVKFEPEIAKMIQFGFERGIQGNLFHSGLDYRGPSGRIYFGGTSGINVFDPANMTMNPHPPEMVFTDIRLDGTSLSVLLDSISRKPVIVMKEFSVGPDIGTISLDFAAIHFGGTKSNYYEYKLEGFDKTWKKGGFTGSATYTNLPAGDYNFKIRGSNLDGVWSDDSKAIMIRVLPPWYQTWWAYFVYLLLLIIIGWQTHLYMKKRTIRKEREIARERELEQAKEIEAAYTELKTTQAQLIQSEKMASLGELTAGIAHEIKNPLNFVNNFAEVSNELIDEMREEIENQNFEEVNEIASDIKQNLEKINHHGKRADAIVKGMLQHSRSSDGKKEPTDINALADEYLRLAYHGIRAKDKSFNATLKTDFDDSIGKVNIAAQDIGRVILNLITNAFYAVDEKKKSGAENYEPTVTVSSKKEAEKIEIQVADNGNGIPQNILDKIFQPFFTTKPTGQGTGLGLSLSYDIVKAHGGELKVETKEGKGTIFSINFTV